MNKTSTAAATSDKGSSSRPRKAGVLGLAAALGLTFWLYTRPDVMVMLSEQLWACF